jgi:hypothetical protein
MGLASPSSAILSAVIFNALIIVFLIPLALKGVLPPARRGHAAAPQPADLRPGRPHRALRRHQADRPALPPPVWPERRIVMKTLLRPAVSLFVLLTAIVDRHRLSAGRHRHRQAGFPDQAAKAA